LVATFIWLRQMNTATAAMSAELQLREVARAVSVLDDRLLAEAAALDRTVSVLAEDSRIKAGLATQAFDAATLSDMLNEIRERSSFDWLALADASGKVEAVSGLEALKAYQGSELGPTPLIKTAEAKEAAVGRALWFSDGKAVAISCTGVWRAGHAIGFVLLGKTIEASQLARTEKALGVSVGLTAVKGDLVASSMTHAEALKVASHLPSEVPAMSAVGERAFVVAKHQAAGWTNGVVVAALPSSDVASGHLRHLWLPVVFVGVLAATILTHLLGAKSHEKRR
jgi:hypothetical protein